MRVSAAVSALCRTLKSGHDAEAAWHVSVQTGIVLYHRLVALLYMDIDLVIHAPGAQMLARRALPWLQHAHFGDLAAMLVAALGRLPLRAGSVQHIRILDAYGPNPRHPLQDASLLTRLQSLLTPRQAIAVTALDIRSGQATAGFGGSNAFQGGFQGVGSGTGKTSTSGFQGGGFNMSGFSGIGVSAFANSLSYLPAVQRQFGPAVKVRTVSNLEVAQRTWTLP